MKNASASLIIFAIIAFSHQSAFAKPIHLFNNPVFAREGFSSAWITELPSAPEWTVHTMPRGAYQRIGFSGIGINSTEYRAYSFSTSQQHTLTCVIPFTFSTEEHSSVYPYAILIPEIGSSWQVYLNGILLKNAIHSKDAKNNYIPNKRRNAIIYIPYSAFINGTNILALRIIGNPTSEDTGFIRSKRFIIDYMDELQRKYFRIIPTVMIFIYLFIGVYHLFLYSRRIIDSYYMYYGCFSISLFIYLFSKSPFIYDFLSDSNIIERVEQVSLYLLIPFVSAFFDRLHRSSVSVLTRIFVIYTAIMVLATLCLPIHLLGLTKALWRFSAIFMLSYIFIAGILGHFAAEIRRIKLDLEHEMHYPSPLSVISRMIISSHAGYLLIGAGITFACAVFDILDSVFFHTEIVMMSYGFFVFTIGITFGLAKRFQGFFSKIEHLNSSLQKSITETQEADRACAVSEEKYRLIVEKSKDIIFTLDHGFNFISVNIAIQEYLNIDPETVPGMNFFDFITGNADNLSTSLEFIESQLEKLSKKLEPVKFKVNFNTHFASETKELLISLEHITGAGGNEFIGKASPVAENTLLKYVVREYQQYKIGNFISTAEDVSYRITDNLIKYLDQQKVLFVRVALREMLINAIEHGNLGITFEEKSAAMKDGRYINIISERQTDSRFTGRTIEIRYSLSNDRVCYKVTDEGSGFDFHSALDGNISNEANESLLTHGRGILIAKNIFDQITFSKNGSCVELIKLFPQPENAE